jgi:hypothetical protein
MKRKEFKNVHYFGIVLLTLSIWVNITSCENDVIDNSEINNNSDSGSVAKSYMVSEEEAIGNLMDFIDAMENGSKSGVSTRSENKSARTVKSIDVIRTDKQKAVTYSSGSNFSTSIDTLMYLINFEDNRGYALVAADKRTNPIYAITDEGTLSIDSIDKIDNHGFTVFMQNSIANILNDIETYDDENVAVTYAESNTTETIRPLLCTKWGQTGPYNYFCNGYPTGCVITATAQVMSYYKTFTSVQWSKNGESGATRLNWNNIIADSENSSYYGRLFIEEAYSSSIQVAHLMRYLGVVLYAEYSTSGTGASATDAISWMRTTGKLYSTTGRMSYNSDKIVSALNEGDLVFVEGWDYDNTSGTGHVWVIDGIIRQINDGVETRYMHCNWGWNGWCDGYFLDRVFDVNQRPTYVDPKDIDSGASTNTRPLYFRYNVSISVIGR